MTLFWFKTRFWVLLFFKSNDETREKVHNKRDSYEIAFLIFFPNHTYNAYNSDFKAVNINIYIYINSRMHIKNCFAYIL